MPKVHNVLLTHIVNNCYFKPEFNTNLFIVKKILALLSFVTFCLFSYSQNPIATVQIVPSYPGANSEQITSMDAEIRSVLSTDLELRVIFSGTVDIAKIAVKIGLKEGGSDLFYKEFDYGVEDTFEDGTSYSANGNTVTLGLGDFNGYGTYYTEVFVIRGDGSIEEGVINSLN